MNSKLSLFSFKMLLVCVTLSGCWSPQKLAEKKIDSSIIPADFDPKKHIVLIAEMPRLMNPKQRNERITAQLDAAFSELYNYKYIIVSPDEIFTNKKYADSTKYRFAILNTLMTGSHATATTVTRGYGSNARTQPTGNVNVTVIDFQFYDRMKEERYPATGKGFSKLRPIAETFIRLIDVAQEKKGKAKR